LARARAGFFAIAYTNGGPVSAVWGWILVATTNFFVALSMAEIVSAYPIAGGPYFWCDFGTPSQKCKYPKQNPTAR
jgi:amino acid transporter